MAVEKKDKSISVKEFQMWLQGVEEMQPDDWTPDARQWAKIREKISCITAERPPSPAPEFLYRDPRFGAPPPPPPAGEEERPPAFPAGPSSLNTTPPPAAPPLARTTAAGLPVTVTKDGVPGTKTPDIDTSNGKQYRPPFV